MILETTYRPEGQEMKMKMLPLNQAKTVILAAAATTAILGLVGDAAGQVTLSNGSLSMTIRGDNGAIDTATFAGRDFFNPGAPVSDWGLQAGTDTSTFRLNDTSGGTGLPVTVTGSGSTASVVGTYTLGGANLAFTRRYDLVAGQNAVRVTTNLTNNAASAFAVSYFDTFDPDQGTSSFTFNDVYASGGTRLARGSSSSTSNSGGAPTLSFVAATNNASATLAAGSPFQINSGSLLNTFFTSPFDGNGAYDDSGVHLGLRTTLTAGATYIYSTVFAFGTTPTSADAAALASAAGGGAWSGSADGPAPVSGPDGNWSTAGNWSNGFAPSSADDATFSLASTYTVNVTSAATAKDVNVSAGTVTFALGTNSLQAAGNGYVGDAAGQTATLNLSGTSGSLQTQSHFYVGSSGKGTLNQSGGSLVIPANANMYIGRTSTGDGTYNLSGGTANIGQILIVGNDGKGTLDATGGILTAQELWTARVSGTGTASFSNTTANLTALRVGGNDATSGGTGTVNIGSGATANVTGVTKVWDSLNSKINLAGGTLKTGVLDLGGVPSRFLGNGTTTGWTSGTLELNNSDLSVGSTGLLGGTTVAPLVIGAGKTLREVRTTSTSAGRISIDGSLTVSGGTVSTSVGTTGLSGADVRVLGGGLLTVSAGSLTLGGPMSVGTSGAGTGTGAFSGGTIQVGTESGTDHRIFVGQNSVGVVNQSGTANVSTTGDLEVGYNNTGTYNLSGGTLTIAGTTYVENAASKINLSGGSLATNSLTLTSSSNLNFTNGTLQINGGTYTQPTGALVVSGSIASDNPLFQFSAGATNSTNNVTGVVIGGAAASRKGQLLVEGGSVLANTGTGAGGPTVFSGNGYVGLSAGSSGTATVAGVGSKWTNSLSLRVGDSGSGVVNVQNGGEVSNSSGYIGINSGSSGTVNLMGSGSKWTNAADVLVGDAGTGALNVEAGGNVTNTYAVLGYKAGSSGTATVTGSGSKWTNSSDVYVGHSGSGTLNVSAQGNVSNGYGYLGYNSGSSGTATVTGVGSTWTNTGNLSVGFSGKGVLNVENSGSVVVTGTTSVNNVTGSQINVTGGTLKTNSLSLSTASNLNFNNGTLQINGGTYTQPTGALVVSGSGGGDNPLLKFSAGATNSLNSVQGVVIGGAAANSQGELLIEGGSVLANTGDGSSIVGPYGGTYVYSGAAFLGLNSGYGSVTVTGSGSKWTNTGELYVGYSGNGTLTVQDGGEVSNTSGYLAYDRFTSGTATVAGSGSKWTNTGELYVGYYGSGTLNVQDGGTVSNTNGYVGGYNYYGNNNNTATVSGNGSKWTNTGELYVGYSGNGTLYVQDGGVVSNTNGYVGYNNYYGYNYNSATVTGNGSKWTNTGELYVGYYGTGTLNVQDGGTVSNTNGYVGYSNYLGYNNNTATVSGNGSTWTNTGELYVGYLSTGTLSVQGGGVVTNTNGYVGYYSNYHYSNYYNNTATVTGNGSKWSNTGDLYVGNEGTGGTGTLGVDTGGTVVVTGTTRVGYDSYIYLGTGGTLKTGALDLGGDGSRLEWTGGTLNLSGGSTDTGLTIPATGTLKGTGTIGGALNITGTLAPGNSPGSMTVNGTLDFAAGSNFSVDVNGTSPGTGYDQVTVNGLVDVAGANLLVDLGGFSPTIGQSFLLINNDGTDAVTGKFANLSQDPTGWSFFNQTVGGNTYYFRVDYNTGVGANDVTLSVVPEPTSLGVIVLGATAMLARRRRG